MISKPRNSLRFKLVAIVISMTLLLSVISIIIGYGMYHTSLLGTYFEKAQGLSRTAAKMLDGDKITEYLKTRQKDEYYEEIQKYLNIICDENGVTYFYVTNLADSETKTITCIWDTHIPRVDTPPRGFLEVYDIAADYADTGGFYDKLARGDDIPAFFDSYVPDAEFADEGVYIGSYVEAATPVYNSAGAPVGYVHINYYVNNLRELGRHYLFILAVITFLVSGSMVILYLFILGEVIIKPLNALTLSVDKWTDFMVRREALDEPDESDEADETKPNKPAKPEEEKKDKRGKSQNELDILSDAVKIMDNKMTETISELKMDPFTRLLNRVEFDNTLDERFRLYKEDGSIFTLILIDIDKFKKVNDLYGHAFGDEVLQTLAKVLTANARSDDLCFRYGGEEFAVIMSGIDSTEAFGFADRLRIAFNSVRMSYIKCKADGSPEKVLNLGFSLSLGLFSPKEDTQTPRDVFKKADEALYKAKHTGRNKSVVAS